ncbi:SPOSA6832_03096 [Sporobolomyces salmonicolor]|uniref:SPOSA6832_03096-mRNA-1:cds n=1 Tax=Sporidiobolus salmonicolor TaxID=5005 RepID=A0A0D6EP47_SPOSA|nr:SPOSA6832_03096 [Sporobolomyces salmonicolor]
MGLVDYGSDSDSDSGSGSGSGSGSPPPLPAAPRPAVAAPSSSSSSFLSLPPPKSTSSLKLPPPSSSSTPSPAPTPAPAPAPPKKKDKAPLRIVLDLPSASSASADDQEPAKKRPKLGNGGGLTGLAAMLPKPKNEVKPQVAPAAKAPAASAGSEAGAAGLGDMFGGEAEAQRGPGPAMFVPPSVKGKGKGKGPAPAAPPKLVEEPAVDFFGIGSVTSSTSSTSSTVASSTAKSSLTISSAPSVSSAPSTSAPSSGSASNPFGTPTASDPYPGFTQLPSGEWVAKDAETYEMWMAWSASQAQHAGGDVPKGFEAREIDEKGMVEVDEAQRAREAWATRPSTVPGKDAEGYKKSGAIKGIPKQASQAARRKGQLSSLIASAHDNRAELEERIAQARANRKSAGNKYGF